MRKYIFVITLFIFGLEIYSQTEFSMRNGNRYYKYYQIYESFDAADNVPADSVQGLRLTSNGFKCFPEKILRYKNLTYLEISALSWSDVPDSLTKKQQKKLEKLKIKYPESFFLKEYFKMSKIGNIPKEIAELKKLEVVDFLVTEITNKKKFMKIYEYLPNAHIIPDKQFLEENYR